MNWADFHLPPINLWNKPLQHGDYSMSEGTTFQTRWVIKEYKPDNVNKPAHYMQGGIEVIDYIEAKGFDKNWNLANVIKYVSRAGYKISKLEDLKKAQFYLTWEIKKLECMPDV